MSAAVRPSFILALSAIVGLVPFASDMYLASLPEIGREFAAPVWVIQLTLTGFLLLLGIGQLIAGPVTDAVGRRRPLLCGLALFVAGSALAAAAGSVWILVGARILQGIGGAIAVVVANSSVRDRVTGEAATRLYATLMTVASLAPVLAPTLGGLIDQQFGWRAVFLTLTVLGALVLAAAAVYLPESLPVNRRAPLSPRSQFSGYGGLFRSRGFLLPLAALSAIFMMLFGYIGGASYVYQGAFGLGSASFGLVFGATGLALLVGALLANRLALRWDSRTLAIAGVAVTVGGSGLAVLATAVHLPLGILVAGMALNLLGIGLCEPALMGKAMSSVREGAGAAAAVLGASQYILGAAATAVAGVVSAASPLGWTSLLLACTVIALVLSALMARDRRNRLTTG